MIRPARAENPFALPFGGVLRSPLNFVKRFAGYARIHRYVSIKMHVDLRAHIARIEVNDFGGWGRASLEF
jgi:hypothetical protein